MCESCLFVVDFVCQLYAFARLAALVRVGVGSGRSRRVTRPDRPSHQREPRGPIAMVWWQGRQPVPVPVVPNILRTSYTGRLPTSRLQNSGYVPGTGPISIRTEQNRAEGPARRSARVAWRVGRRTARSGLRVVSTCVVRVRQAVCAWVAPR